MPNVAHFILGRSAAGSLAQAFPAAKIIGMADPFDIGPCRFDGTSELSAWLHHRDAWCREAYGEDAAPFFFHNLGGCHGFEDAIAGVNQAILWVAEGAVEQLHACWLASVLPSKVELMHGEPENRSDKIGTLFVGHVRSEWFADAPIRSISRAERATQSDLWQAFVEASPTRFFELANRAASERLTSGLHALVSHFPVASTGLTDFERRVLTELSRHPGEPCIRSIGDVVGHTEGPVLPSDWRLLDTLFEFEEGGLLIEVKSGQYAPGSVFEFTDLGSKVLAGEANRVHAIGYDRWFGGTHVTSADGNIWWRSGNDITREPT